MSCRFLVLALLFLLGCSDPSGGPLDLCHGLTCSGFGRCVHDGLSPYCDCDEGFHAKGLACVENSDSHPCEDVTCSGAGACAVSSGQPSCVCDPGFGNDFGPTLCVPSGPIPTMSVGAHCDHETLLNRTACSPDLSHALYCGADNTVGQLDCTLLCSDGFCGLVEEERRLWCLCPSSPCPEGMVYIESQLLCIDAYEASEGDQQQAESRRNRNPWTRVTWAQAAAACERAGKVLCTSEDWTRACSGPYGSVFPYGPTYEPGRCHDYYASQERILPTGTLGGCQGFYEGLYDMSGNVSEWTRSGADHNALVAVGALTDAEERQKCATFSLIPVGEYFGDLGFRCCLYPQPEQE